VNNDLEPLAYTVKDAVRVLRLSERRIRDLVASGRLPARREGQKILIRRQDAEAYLNGLPADSEVA